MRPVAGGPLQPFASTDLLTALLLTALCAMVLAGSAAGQGIALEWVQIGDPVEDAGISGGLAWGDFDGDGDLDLGVADWQNQDNNLFRNPGADGHWLRVRLEATGGNRLAIGARIRLATAGEDGLAWQRRDVAAGTSFRSQEPAVQTFGLGAAERVEELVVEWPSGLVERLENLDVDRVLTIAEGQGVVADFLPASGPPSVGPEMAAIAEAEGVETAVARYRKLRSEAPEAGTTVRRPSGS